ncbi:hypothetical protein PENTCL1PPCAC_30175, partial [Pristionchus entomophagus]
QEINKYSFFFSGENSACKDYVTEKYWSRYHLPTIPIVLRREDYVNVNMLSHSVIALDDFDSPEAMACTSGIWSRIRQPTRSTSRGAKEGGRSHHGTRPDIATGTVGCASDCGRSSRIREW